LWLYNSGILRTTLPGQNETKITPKLRFVKRRENWKLEFGIEKKSEVGRRNAEVGKRKGEFGSGNREVGRRNAQIGCKSRLLVI
jgi:hypothetical protein